MSLKENGISSPLQIYKESTSKKNKKDKNKIIIQFIVIFFLSHIARTLVQSEEPIQKAEEYKTKEGYVTIELEVASIIPEDQNIANLLNQTTLQEIEEVKVIERHINQEGMLKVKLEVPTHKSTWIINRPSDWKLIPYRKVIILKRNKYEINF